MLKLNERAGATRLKINQQNKEKNSSMYREIVLAASSTSSEPETKNEEKIDKEPVLPQHADENIKLEVIKPTLIKSLEGSEKPELEKIDQGSAKSRKKKKKRASEKQEGAKPKEEKQKRTSEKQKETKPKEEKKKTMSEKQEGAKPKEADIRLGQCDDWTDYL